MILTSAKKKSRQKCLNNQQLASSGGVSCSSLNDRLQVSTRKLPTWEKVVAIAELYLLYCDCQPLPLFHRGSFISSLERRDPEIIYAMLALSIRFDEESSQDNESLADLVNGYAEAARTLVIRRVLEGPVELSTLQCLCLLSLVDFTSRDNPTAHSVG